MTSSFTEQEIKFDVDQSFRLPDLGPLLPSGARVRAKTQRLSSEYFDTPDRALLRAGMTLRRRTGSTDRGWQLKVPLKRFRQEIRVDSQDAPPADTVPPELARLLRGVVRDDALREVARIDTERGLMRLIDVDGQALVEIADDSVSASTGGEVAVVTTWREIEVELDDGDPRLLKDVGRLLRRAGARTSQESSKLARAMPDEPAPAVPSTTSAAAVIAPYLVEQHRAMLAGDVALRRGDSSVIHRTRVATRRLRSTLRVFAPLFEAERAAALDDELQWYAGLLGEVRDRQVLTRRLHQMIEDVDVSLLLGPVRARIDLVLGRETDEHWNRLIEELDGERYLRLLDDVAAFVKDPPWSPQARRRPDVVTDLVKAAGRKASKRLRRAAGDVPVDRHVGAEAGGDAARLHRARKAAKRARYAAEAARPLLGSKKSRRQAERYEQLQELLGEHQDSLVSAGVLRRLGALAGTEPDENGFSFGLLYEREQALAADARRRARKWA
ncbi:MAG: CYTH and CHAD domain-containing protein [Actinobacteria bacterium]|nr:CYTH and CHAD domain-containing protein [Actinomycetota bacterium]